MPLPRPRGKKIGLLGGSFNPAHAGHMHISRLALRLLKLDEVWWLVSPQNPLKSTEGMATLEARLKSAMRITHHSRRITPLALEKDLGTRYTIDTLKALKQHYPQVHFVWLMGADNLVQFDKWKNWKEIFHTVPIAVFDRATTNGRALESKAAKLFARQRCFNLAARQLAFRKAPAWTYFLTPKHPASATALRRGKHF